MSGEQRCSLDRLLDAGLYAPVGFLVRRDAAVSDLAEVGRKQLAFSRSLGRAAIKSITKGLTDRPDEAAAPLATAAPTDVDGYDEMTAKQVIALLTTCSDTDVAWIAQREQQGKQRVTILRAVEKRQSTS